MRSQDTRYRDGTAFGNSMLRWFNHDTAGSNLERRLYMCWMIIWHFSYGVLYTTQVGDGVHLAMIFSPAISGAAGGLKKSRSVMRQRDMLHLINQMRAYTREIQWRYMAFRTGGHTNGWMEFWTRPERRNDIGVCSPAQKRCYRKNHPVIVPLYVLESAMAHDPSFPGFSSTMTS